MRTFKAIAIVIVTAILMTGCGIHSAVVENINNNSTNVELGKKNFKVIDRVSGKSTATFILGIGGLSNKSLVAQARAQMLENANLTGNARAIVNVTTEKHTTLFVPFYYRKTIIVSAHIVEFTE